MVKHIIVWNFKEDMSVEEKQTAAAKIKAELEALQGVIEGLIEIKVEVEHLSSSSGELMLDSSIVKLSLYPVGKLVILNWTALLKMKRLLRDIKYIPSM